MSSSTRPSRTEIAEGLGALFVIAVGSFFIHSANWHPFAPHGYLGIKLGPLVVGGQRVRVDPRRDVRISMAETC